MAAPKLITLLSILTLYFYSAMALDLLFNFGIEVAHCPNECLCNSPGVVDCSNANLTSIPSIISNDTLKLILSYNFLNSIPNLNNLSQLILLQELDLSYCDISEIPDTGIFSIFPQLKVLRLNGNRLVTVLNNTFTGLTLDELYLNDNTLLGSLDTGSFTGSNVKLLEINSCSLSILNTAILQPLSQTLTKLHLSNNLQPLVIADGTFSGYSLDELLLVNNGFTTYKFLDGTKSVNLLNLSDNLLGDTIWDLFVSITRVNQCIIRNINTVILNIGTHQDAMVLLDVSENPLTNINSNNFKYIPNMVQLTMSKCSLQVLPQTFGFSLNRLKSIDLSGNKFTYFNSQWFDGMYNVETVDMSTNEIQYTDGLFLKPFLSLVSLTMIDNPWYCDCNLLAFSKWLISTSFVTNVGTCQSPPSLVGKNIIDLFDSTTLNCTTPAAHISLSKNIVIDQPYGVFCIGIGDPTPDITIVLPNNESYTSNYVEDYSNPLPQIVSLQHIIPAYNCTYVGLYSCTATNVAGTVTNTLTLNDNCKFKDITNNPDEFFMIARFTLQISGVGDTNDSIFPTPDPSISTVGPPGANTDDIVKPYVKETDLSNLPYIIALIVVIFLLIAVVIIFIYYVIRKRSKKKKVPTATLR